MPTNVWQQPNVSSNKIPSSLMCPCLSLQTCWVSYDYCVWINPFDLKRSWLTLTFTETQVRISPDRKKKSGTLLSHLHLEGLWQCLFLKIASFLATAMLLKCKEKNSAFFSNVRSNKNNNTNTVHVQCTRHGGFLKSCDSSPLISASH